MPPRVRVIERQVSAPNIPATRIRQRGQKTAEALSGLGATIKKLADEKEQREQLAEINAIENEIRENSRVRFNDAGQNRLGRAALADEEAGTKGVYDDYNEEVNKQISDAVGARIKPDYKDRANARLTSVANSYKDRFAAFEAQQAASHRKAVMVDKINQISDDLNLDMEQTAQGADSIAETLSEVREAMKEGSGGTDIEAAFKTRAETIVKNALLAKSANNAEGAIELLKDENVRGALDPSDIEAMEKNLEQKRVDQAAEAWLSNPENQGASGEALLRASKDVFKDDPDTRKKVEGQINWNMQQERRLENEEQANRQDEYYNDLFVTGNVFKDGKRISPITVDQDESLTPDSKRVIKSWMGNPSGATDRVNKFAIRQAWQEMILRQEKDEADIMQAVHNGEVPPDTGQVLLSFKKNIDNSPQYGQAITVLNSKYADQLQDKEDKAAYYEGLDQWVRDEQKKTGALPTYDQILKLGDDLAKDSVETGFWKSNRPAFSTFVGGPGISRGEAKASQFREIDETFPNAVFNEEHNAVILEQVDPQSVKVYNMATEREEIWRR